MKNVRIDNRSYPEKVWRLSIILLTACFSAGCNPPRSTHALPSAAPDLQVGVASRYAAYYHGKITASGEVFDTNKLTAAHRNYPFGSAVRVTHLADNRSVVVRINDRGPCVTGRIIDLSTAAAVELGMIESGVATVTLQLLDTKPDK